MSEFLSASRTSGSWNATENHRVLYFSIGHACVTFLLNAYSAMTNSGR
jgi:hypothetical protein